MQRLLAPSLEAQKKKPDVERPRLRRARLHNHLYPQQFARLAARALLMTIHELRCIHFLSRFPATLFMLTGQSRVSEFYNVMK